MQFIKDLWAVIAYGWFMTKRYRLRPWKSPAMRWRMETVYGIQPNDLTAKLLFKTLWKDRKQVFALARWVMDMKQHK